MKKKLLGIAILAALAGVVCLVLFVIIPKSHYDKGKDLQSLHKWDEAVTEFESAGNYSDAVNQILATRYAEGMEKRQEKEWDGAVLAFQRAGNYNDSQTQIRVVRYEEGEYKFEQSDWEGAVTAFLQAGDYLDSNTRVYSTRYAEGESKRSSRDWESAVLAFEQAGIYADAPTQILATYYQKGIAKKDDKDWDGAIEAFEKAGDFSDARTQIMDTDYLHALDLHSLKKYDEAYALLKKITGYRDVDTLLSSDNHLLAVSHAIQDQAIKQFSTVGNVVTFGHYEQDNDLENGKEAIEWIVLDVKGTQVLLFSRYAVDYQPYDTRKHVAWKTSSIRSWLNDSFLNDAFDSIEQGAIVSKNVNNSLSSYASEKSEKTSKAGENTVDKVYLLSYSEFFSNYRDKIDSFLCLPTAYAKALGIYNDYKNSSGYVWWWLRSPGPSYHTGDYVAGVITEKGNSWTGEYVEHKGAVRPIIWIDLNSASFIQVIDP